MTLSRRKMLSLVGGGSILAATAASATFLTTRTPTKALLPWQTAGNYSDPRMRALSYALLAPNPHNRQPWIADLAEPDTVVLYRDLALNLPETDPFDRQLTIGMGCFIELMVQAAAQEGVGIDLEYFPEGETDTAAIVRARFTGTTQSDPLFKDVLNRHTCREPYDIERQVKDTDIAEILAAASQGVRADGSNEAQKVKDLRNLTIEAMLIELNTPHTYRESIDLFRIGRSEIEANPDGIFLGGPMLETLALAGLLSRELAADPTSTAFKQGEDIFRTSFAATPAFIWLATKGNTRMDQINAGRTWVRTHLSATALGLSMQPVSQSLQEYSEMAEHYKDVHQKLAQDGETLQMLGRLGYGPEQPPAPRWPLETRLLNA